MSKLKDLVGKGVRLIVTDTESPLPAEAPAAERDLGPDAFAGSDPKPVTRSEVAADVADFKAVYKEAGIELRPHGYGVDRVGEMLESKRLATLGRDVKAAAVMAALETAGVPMRDVIEDAVLRDKALDAFLESKGRELEELRTRTQARVTAVKAEMDAFLKAKNAEMEGLKKAEEEASQTFLQLQTRKRREEERLHDVVAHFLEGAPNPITTSPSASPSPSPDKPDRA
jgi:lambda repressor-like predicted transcriptional regulator